MEKNMIVLKPVTMENFWDVITLKIHKNQEQYIPDNIFLIAQSKIQPVCIPLAIYNDDTIVGFLMYGLDENYWIYILMIDNKYQGKGYAKEALKTILREIKKDKNNHKVLLAVNKGNIGAIKLYEHFGFTFNGKRLDENMWAVKVYQKLLNEEYIMELQY
jgi:diamine N-acetyltransferase